MRRGTMTRLLLLALIAPIAAHNAAYASKDNKKQPASVASFNKECEGKARTTPEEAIDSALQAATEEIGGFLQDQKPPLIWKPDSAYVREHLLDDMAKPSDPDWEQKNLQGHIVYIKKVQFNVAEEPFAYQVRLLVKVDGQELVHMRKLDEPERKKLLEKAVHQRQWGLGKVLLGIVVFLTCLSGYIRLEDATKGYYTGWLRLGMIGIVCAVGAGLWLTS